MKFSIVAFFLLFLTNDISCNVLEELQESLDSEERMLSQKNNLEIQSSTYCNLGLIKAYGLSGIQESLKRENQYCPQIVDNCCTADDETFSMNYWLQKIQTPLENRYKIYVDVLKYLLGFYKQAEELAKDLEFQPGQNCKNSARKFLSLQFDQRMSEYILEELKLAIKKIADIRKGFYCTICDAATSKQLYQFWHVQDERLKSRMYYSQDFCRNLVESNLKAAYYVQRYVKYYLESMNEIIQCKLNLEEEISFEIQRQDLTRVRNCLFYGDKYFFFFCEKFCEDFQITKINPVFDGYVHALRPYYKLISAHRKNVFFYPNQNQFVKDVSKSEAYIEKQFEKYAKLEVTVKSNKHEFRLDEMQTDFVVNGGLDLHKSAENSLYELNYNSAKLVGVLSAILISLI